MALDAQTMALLRQRGMLPPQRPVAPPAPYAAAMGRPPMQAQAPMPQARPMGGPAGAAGMPATHIQAADLDMDGKPIGAPDDYQAMASQLGIGDQGSAQAQAQTRVPPPAAPTPRDMGPDPTAGWAPSGYQSPQQLAASMPAAGSPEERSQLGRDRAAVGDKTPLPAPVRKAEAKEERKAGVEGVGWKSGATERQGAGGGFTRIPNGASPSQDVSLVSPQTRAQTLGALQQQQEAQIGHRANARSTWGDMPGQEGGEWEGGALQAERDVNRDQAEQYQREAAQFALSSNEEMRKAADIRRQMGDHLAEQQKLDDAANRGIDPKRLAKHLGVAGNIAAAVASGLGAFGAAITHSQNYAQQILEKSADQEIEAQRTDLEHAGQRAAAHRSEYAQKLALLGDPNAAEAAAKADRYAMAASMAKYQGSQSNDRILKARADEIAASFDAKKAEYNQETHKYLQASTGSGLNDKILHRMQEIRDKSGGTVPVDDARRAATAEVLSAYGPTGEQGLYPKPGKGAAGEQKESMASRDAIANIDKLLALREKHNGGTLSPDDTATAETLAARTQERLVAALGKTNAQLLKRTQELVPDDPLAMKAAGLVGADPIGQRLRTAKQMLLEEMSRRTPGGGSGETPEDVDADIKGAGEEEK